MRRGIKLPFKLCGGLQGMSSIISVVVVLIGLVVWSARQEARIGELERHVKAEEQHVAELEQRGTRALAERISVMSEHVDALNAASVELQKRVDQINTSGSQAGLILAERLANDEREALVTRERVAEFGKRLADDILRAQKLSGRIDVLENEVQHLKNVHRRAGIAIPPNPNP
jgi:hypothetical protein